MTKLQQAFQDLIDAIPETTLAGDAPLRGWVAISQTILNEDIGCVACDREGATAGGYLTALEYHTCTANAEREAIVRRLHERIGICGHCGKRKCGGRADHSTLPEKARIDDVLAAINAEVAS